MEISFKPGHKKSINFLTVIKHKNLTTFKGEWHRRQFEVVPSPIAGGPLMDQWSTSSGGQHGHKLHWQGFQGPPVFLVVNINN